MKDLEDQLLEALNEEPAEMSEADWEHLRQRVGRVAPAEEPDGLEWRP